MFERFTERARKIIVVAHQEALALSHNYIGTEHLLLALAGDEASTARSALAYAGVTREKLLAIYPELIDPKFSANPPSGHQPPTPAVHLVLELAIRQSLQLGVTYVNTEHLLLGLLQLPGGTSTLALSRLGVNKEELSREVKRLIDLQSELEVALQNSQTLLQKAAGQLEADREAADYSPLRQQAPPDSPDPS